MFSSIRATVVVTYYVCVFRAASTAPGIAITLRQQHRANQVTTFGKMPLKNADKVLCLACEPLTDDNVVSDTSLVRLGYIIHDNVENQTVSSRVKIIRTTSACPTNEIGDLQHSEGNDFDEAVSLKTFLDQLEVDVGDCSSLIVVTNGPLALREVIHPKANLEGTAIPEVLYSYVDVDSVFRNTYPEAKNDVCKNVSEIATHLGITVESQTPEVIEVCHLLHKIMQQMAPHGSMQMIQANYSQLSNSSPLKEDTLVRVQGLATCTTEQKLAKLFAGLNIESSGISICVASNGHPSGEAFIRFTDRSQRDLALKRNGMKFGSQIIEVTKATIQEYCKIDNQVQVDAMSQGQCNFLNLADGDSVFLRMRGLPYNTKASEIVSFFGDESPVYHGEKGILFVYHQDGRPTGDAFVLFQTSEHSKVALTKHRQIIGKRYVELFQLSRQEIINVFTRHSLPANLLSFTTRRSSRSSTADSVNFLKNNTYLSNVRNIVRLRGLPYSASVQDILDFLEEFAKCVVPAGVHMVYNLQGKPTGDAFIEMQSADHAQKSSESLHKKHIGERYIEVFQCSSSDMTLMLMNGISNHKHHNGWLSTPYPPRTPPHVPTAFTYPSVPTTYSSSPASVPHSTNSPMAIISVPSSPTVSPGMYMTSPGYLSYQSQSYSAFNFSYPSPGMPVDVNVPSTPPLMSPAAYDSSAVFYGNQGYHQISSDYPSTPIDPMYLSMNPYMSPGNGYYSSAQGSTQIAADPNHFPSYVETYSC